MLTAGRSGEDYTSRLHALNFPELFDKHELGSYIEELRNEWAAEYNFVLVDSRTGVTDIGGICTVHLADVLVLLFTTTESSTEGALEILERARKAQERFPRDRKRLFAVPVPARDESRTEYERATQWKDRFAERFGEIYRDWLPNGIKPREAIDRLRIPYVPYWSFGEQLPAIEEGTGDPASLGYSYQILARLLATRLDWYKALEGQDPAQPPIAKLRELDSSWLTKHRQAALKSLAATGLTGYMEVSHFCLDSFLEKSQPELFSAALQAQVRLSGWPIGIVLDDEHRPRPTNDGIIADIATKFPAPMFDYWALNKGGDFYTVTSLIEDEPDEQPSRKVIHWDTRIIRTTEALLHCANIYKLLGVQPNAHIELRVGYGGLRGRSLTAASPSRNIMFSPRKNLLENEVPATPVTFRLGAVEADIVDLVKKLCAPLFIIFDLFEVSDDNYRQIATAFLNGNIIA